VSVPTCRPVIAVSAYAAPISSAETGDAFGLKSDMACRTYVLNEIVGTSTDDVNGAIRNGIRLASRTLRNLDWFEVVEVRGAIVDGEVAHYQVTMKVGFRLEDKEEAE